MTSNKRLKNKQETQHWLSKGNAARANQLHLEDTLLRTALREDCWVWVDAVYGESLLTWTIKCRRIGLHSCSRPIATNRLSICYRACAFMR